MKPNFKLKNSNNHKYWKPSIQDAINSSCITTTVNNLNIIIEQKKANYANYNLTLQPFIAFIDNEVESYYLLVIDNNYYQFNTFMSCLDKTFKSFFALGIKYPVESKSVWLFLQKIFFDIDILKTDLTSQLVCALNDFKF